MRAIGLSNFRESDIDNIVESATVTPMVNQLLAHAGNLPTALIDHSRNLGMVVEAYSPIGHGELLHHPRLTEIAERLGVTVPRLAIRFVLQLGLLPLPKTANPAHMAANADLDFEIPSADMDRLLGLDAIDYGEASVFPVYSGA